MEIVACNIGAVTPMRIMLDVIGLDVITWMINSIQGQSLEIIMGVGYWESSWLWLEICLWGFKVLSFTWELVSGLVGC